VLRGIDHIAIAVPDPDAAAADLEQRLGLVARGGGRHEGLGTRNRLVWLADGSYLELIGVEDEAQAGAWAMGAATLSALQRGGGLAAYALDDRPLRPDVRALLGNGSRIADPVHGSRLRPDGELVEWWTAVPPHIGPDGLPFLIEHAMTGAEWGTDALAQRAGYVHRLGSPVRLVRLDLAVADPTASAAEHAQQLGMIFSLVGDSAVCSIGQHVVRLNPASQADAPVVVTLAADVQPREVELFGVRFRIERAELPSGSWAAASQHGSARRQHPPPVSPLTNVSGGKRTGGATGGVGERGEHRVGPGRAPGLRLAPTPWVGGGTYRERRNVGRASGGTSVATCGRRRTSSRGSGR